MSQQEDRIGNANVIFAHFAATGITLLLRYRSRPTLRSMDKSIDLMYRCSSCLRRWLTRLCTSRLPEQQEDPNPTDLTYFFSGERGYVKWYWFHLAVQVGFTCREFRVIRGLGWTWKVVLAQVATWLTIIITSFELWNFSKVRCEVAKMSTPLQEGNDEERAARIVAREERRDERIKQVDSLLDMLLLPVNIVFFSAFCVRALELQPETRLPNMVATIMEAPDIYEAAALWSVLEIFVRTVEGVHDGVFEPVTPQGSATAPELRCRSHRAPAGTAEGQETPSPNSQPPLRISDSNPLMTGASAQLAESNLGRHKAERKKHFKIFEGLARFGVKIWVYTQFLVVVLELILIGLISIYLPTLCFRFSPSCDDCNELFEKWFKGIVLVLAFVLFSFALMFIVKFEQAYSEELEDAHTDPMWKFLGVKGIVSVTYTQWFVLWAIVWLFALEPEQLDKYNTLLYTIWMPVLALVHMNFAYPYRDSDQATYRIIKNSTLECGDDGIVQDFCNDLPGNVHHKTRRDKVVGCQIVKVSKTYCSSKPFSNETLRSAKDCGHDYFVTVQRPSDECKKRAKWLREWMFIITQGEDIDVRNSTAVSTRRILGEIIPFLIPATLACFATTWSILALLPPDSEVAADRPLHTTFCERDLVSYLEDYPDYHLDVSKETLSKLDRGFLQICAEAELTCKPGYVPSKPNSTVRIKCNPNETYEVSPRSCASISCSKPKPEEYPHAVQRKSTNYDYGVVILYDCVPGYKGNLSLTCNTSRQWEKHGDCVEVTCPSPPDVPHARPVLPNISNVTTGMVVRYQCDNKFNGTPTATCGDDGSYVKLGRCKPECSAPPKVQHASPQFDNDIAVGGWFEGMRCPYVCDQGFRGNVSAVCDEDGKFTVSGTCLTTACTQPLLLPHATAIQRDVVLQHFLFGKLVHYNCNPPDFKGNLSAVCNKDGIWDITGECIEVTCGLPPQVEYAAPISDPNISNMTHLRGGEVVHYQCKPGFEGSANALCGPDGRFITSGECSEASLSARSHLFETSFWTENVILVAAVALVCAFLYRQRCRATPEVVNRDLREPLPFQNPPESREQS